jgi:cytochrome b561
MAKNKRKTNSAKTNIAVDLTLLSVFLIALAPEATGLLIHEWLGVAFGGVVVSHLLLHWKWLAQVTRRFLGKLKGPTRINYILAAILFADVSLIIFSGLMISQVATPSLALQAGGSLWYGLHELTANLSLVLVAAHLGLHWKWIVNALKRYLLKPVISFGQIRKPQSIPLTIERSMDQ